MPEKPTQNSAVPPNGRQASRRPDRRRISRRQEEFETGLELARANLRIEMEASEPPADRPKFFPEIGEEGEWSFLPADLAFETATA
jgi:hypothetical protein